MSKNGFRVPPKAKPNQQLKLGTAFREHKPITEDELLGKGKVKCHEDYAAELEAEREAAGADWHTESLEFFARLQGRG